jgi:Region found in RelA / SpoT proteins
MVPDSIERRFARAKPRLDLVGKQVRETVYAYCGDQGFAFAERMKQAESISAKIETGRFNRWSELDDLYACAVIVPTLVEEARAIEFLRRVFVEVELRKRGTSAMAPDVFRFDAPRFIGRLRCPAGEDPAEEHDQKFEVQVRSAFEHAWVVTTHKLVYKGAQVEWGRLRLAAQLKAAVEQLDVLVLGFDQTATHVSESAWAEVQARKEIVTAVRGLVDGGTIPTELAPGDWARFSSNVYDIICAGKGVTRDPFQRAALVTRALEAVGAELQRLGPGAVPRSVSLFQFFFSILAKAAIIKAPLYRFVPPVTQELEELFPEVRGFGNGMSLEE